MIDAAGIEGSVASGFEGVVDAFASTFARGGEAGAAFAAYRGGEPVVDLWGGVADRQRAVPWRRDTLVPVFSGTKGLVATCLLLLVERGALDPDARVCDYWPEFATAGKEGIRVRDLASHRAGLPGLLTPVTVAEATDHVRMAHLLAAQSPIAAPDDGPLYHALTFGWLAGELVRRVDGRSIGRFLREEVADALGLELWIGIPDRVRPRVAVIERAAGFAQGQVVEREADEIAWSIWANPPRFADGELAANDPRWQAAEVPASNGIVAARSLARLYGGLADGGVIDGRRLLAEDTIERARRRLSAGHDPYLGGDLAFGFGFELQTDEARLGPPGDAFGHRGAGGSAHGAWPRLRVGFSYAPNRLATVGAADPRAHVLLDALHRAASGER